MSASVSFGYRAVRPDGTVESGILEAADREAAVAALVRMGRSPVDVQARPPGDGPGRAAGAEDLALGLRALASLLEAGLPMSRSLAALDGLVPPPWLPVLGGLRARVQQGARLSASLASTGLPFPPHVIGVIEAGEAGSGLPAAVGVAAGLLEERAAARTALRSALAYPLMLLVAGGASVALLVGVVLPRFVELFADSGQALPLSTRVVLALGGAARVGALPAAAAALVALAAVRAWTSRPEGRLRWHALLLAAPVLGPLRRLVASASAAAALSALLRSGVPLASALQAAAPAAGDEAMRARLLRVRGRVVSGEALSSALKAESALTPVAVRLVRVGEETGDLGAMLGHAARIHREQAATRIQRLTARLEPALVILFGGLVLLVASALLQSMYGLQPGL